MITDTAKVPLCRHLKTNGRRCQSPALTGGALCYFHSNLHHAHRRPRTVEALSSGWQEYAVESEGDPEGDLLTLKRVYPRQDEIQFPPLEDAESVQLATSMLFQAIATGQIYFKRARLLLYTLKIACINQRALTNARAAETDLATIPSRIVRTEDGLPLAPPDDEEPAPPAESPTPAAASPAHSSKLKPCSSRTKPPSAAAQGPQQHAESISPTPESADPPPRATEAAPPAPAAASPAYSSQLKAYSSRTKSLAVAQDPQEHAESISCSLDGGPLPSSSPAATP